LGERHFGNNSLISPYPYSDLLPKGEGMIPIMDGCKFVSLMKSTDLLVPVNLLKKNKITLMG